MEIGLTRRSVLASAIGAAAGCRRNRSDGVGGAPVTLVWYAGSMTNTHQDPRRALIDAFQKERPDVRIELVSLPSDTETQRRTLEKAITRASNDPVPDVYTGDSIWPAEFAAKKLVRPLDDDFPDEVFARFPEELLAAAGYGQGTYAVPFRADQSVLLYRKDLLDRAERKAPETWEDLVRTASHVLRTSGDRRLRHGFLWQGKAYEGLTCVWTEFATDAGVNLDRLQVDTPEALRALSFMRELVDGPLSRGVTDMDELASLESFRSGEAVFLRAWSSNYLGLTASDLSHRQVGIAPMPGFAGGRAGASTIGGWHLYLNPFGRHQEQAKAFVQWLTGPVAQLILAQYSTLPVNEAVQDHPAVQNNPGLSIPLKVRKVQRPSTTPRYSEVSRILYTEVHQALNGDDPATALKRAQNRLDAVLREPGTAPR